ncbi:hypothetical protein CEXT_724141 [Caerostris extrusa]|uniref:Uncharacterized protein n=1 Tax=Caerostris extrusa TaxID=172846 RepID=A0AAV4PDI6_CAEEX|nr:hypothetical protein CEXT_724141 [Caerostris extrusa]
MSSEIHHPLFPAPFFERGVGVGDGRESNMFFRGVSAEGLSTKQSEVASFLGRPRLIERKVLFHSLVCLWQRKSDTFSGQRDKIWLLLSSGLEKLEKLVLI